MDINCQKIPASALIEASTTTDIKSAEALNRFITRKAGITANQLIPKNTSTAITAPLKFRSDPYQTNGKKLIPCASGTSEDSPPAVRNGRLTNSTANCCYAALKSNPEDSTPLYKLTEKLADIKVPEEFKKEPIKHIFSQNLYKEHWQQQLTALKECKAEICNISMANFTTVDVIDLSKIVNDDVKTLLKKENDALIVVHGECVRKGTHLPISKGCTVIGSGAEISVGQESFNLAIPEAVIRSDDSAKWLSKSDKDRFNWTITPTPPQTDGSGVNTFKLLNDANTICNFLNAGDYPLVYLNQSSLIGVTLDCKNVTQAIIGSKGNIHVINNKIENSLNHGIFLHDGEFIVENNKPSGVNADQFKIITLTPDETTQRMNPIIQKFGFMRNESTYLLTPYIYPNYSDSHQHSQTERYIIF